MCTLRCATGCNHVISGAYISTAQPFVNLHRLRERSHTVCWRFSTVYSNSTPAYLPIFIDWEHLFLISTHLQGIKTNISPHDMLYINPAGQLWRAVHFYELV